MNTIVFSNLFHPLIKKLKGLKYFNPFVARHLPINAHDPFCLYERFLTVYAIINKYYKIMQMSPHKIKSCHPFTSDILHVTLMGLIPTITITVYHTKK